MGNALEFHTRDATGKAGERFFESFVEEELNFTYRKVGPPDIGIDGEIEILRSDRSSTGGFLKVQVKTTSISPIGRATRVPFDEKHLDYFNSLAIQPILALVSLPDKKIWWQPILHKDNYVGPRSGFGIAIDFEKDILTKYSASYLSLLGDHSNAMVAHYILQEVERNLIEIDEKEHSKEFDYTTADFWAQSVFVLTRNMADAKCLLRYERRNTAETRAAEQLLFDMRIKLAARRAWFKKNEIDDLLVDRDYNDD